MIRLLIAEDSPTARALLVQILSLDPEIQIVGEATNGRETVEMTRRLRPDVVTMDITMPVMDGFEATKQIMIHRPTPIVIATGRPDAHEVEVSMRALRAGALTVLHKPSGPGSPDFDQISREFIATIKSMAQVKVVRHWETAPPPPAMLSVTRTPSGARLVAIAASTGGPAALTQILSTLPRDFPVPVLVVQHIANGFVDGLVNWLKAACALKVKVGEQGEPLAPGMVYFAPDDCQMAIAPRGRIELSANLPKMDFCPSATFLFNSAARVFGSSTVGVVLSGMGSDGVEGLVAVRRAGGFVIAQDAPTSVVFGMAAAAIEADAVDLVLPLVSIAPRLLELSMGAGNDSNPHHRR